MMSFPHLLVLVGAIFDDLVYDYARRSQSDFFITFFSKRLLWDLPVV